MKRTINGCMYKAMFDVLNGVLDRNGGNGGLVFLGGFQASFQDGGRNERAGAILDHDPLAVGGDFGEGVESYAYGVLAAWPTGHDADNFAPAFLLAERRSLSDTLGMYNQHDAIDEGGGVEYINRACQGESPCQRHPELVVSLHAATGTGSDNKRCGCWLH